MSEANGQSRNSVDYQTVGLLLSVGSSLLVFPLLTFRFPYGPQVLFPDTLSSQRVQPSVWIGEG